MSKAHIEQLEMVHSDRNNQDIVEQQLSNSTAPIIINEETNKRLLKKIDWKLMPVVRSLIPRGGEN